MTRDEGGHVVVWISVTVAPLVVACFSVWVQSPNR